MSDILPGIRAKRKAAGMALEQLADRLHVTRQAVCRWEVGDALPTADRLPDIAAALGCSIDDLYRDYKTEQEDTP